MTESSPTKRRKIRVFRFRLRTLLVVLTLLCIGLAWYGYRVDRQREAVHWITVEHGGHVIYAFQLKRKLPI